MSATADQATGHWSNNVYALDYMVNKRIKEGWRPLGPAQMVYHADRIRIVGFQTMVKDDDDEEKSTDMGKLTDMVKLDEQILAAARVNHDEAMAKMTERIEAMITHFEEISEQIEEIRLAKDYD